MLVQRPWFPPVPPELKSLFESEGLSLLGICDADADESATAEYRQWCEAGHAGAMRYLIDHAELKYHPGRLLDKTRSVLVAGINYYRPDPQLSNREHADQQGHTTRVARYAWGRDYHRVLGKRLKRITSRLREAYPGDAFRSFTDATPLAERHYADRAGIGFTGRNTLLISGQYGSWLLIAEILSTRHFPAPEIPDHAHGACPRSCMRCIDVCPTGALLGPNRINASLCISYLTIEHRGSIPVELRPKIGAWLFGCDLCQEVCPLNIRARITAETDFLTDRAGPSPDLAGILGIRTEEEFRNRFAGSPLARARRSGLLRNACVVAANTGRVDLLALLRRACVDVDPVIAEHAAWAVRQLTE